jgi:hypothetical protein
MDVVVSWFPHDDAHGELGATSRACETAGRRRGARRRESEGIVIIIVVVPAGKQCPAEGENRAIAIGAPRAKQDGTVRCVVPAALPQSSRAKPDLKLDGEWQTLVKTAGAWRPVYTRRSGVGKLGRCSLSLTLLSLVLNGIDGLGYIAACTTLPSPRVASPSASYSVVVPVGEPLEPCTGPCGLRGQSLERGADTALHRRDWALCPWTLASIPTARSWISRRLVDAVVAVARCRTRPARKGPGRLQESGRQKW